MFRKGASAKKRRKKIPYHSELWRKCRAERGGEGGTEQEIFEGFLEKATQAIVYILSRSIREKAPKEDSIPQRIMEKMPSGKGGEGGTEQEIFEGFLEKATQAIVYILARSIHKKAPKRIFRTTAYYG